jgi:hypothetical protein
MDLGTILTGVIILAIITLPFVMIAIFGKKNKDN